MAEPVLLISSDPFLGASLEAIARGRVQVARLDLATRPAAWPAEPTATVVLDVAAGQRDAVHAWIRRHHPGPLVILLKPGERPPALPPAPDQVVVGRPFRLADLVELLEHPPGPPAEAPAAPAAADRDLLQASAAERRRRLDALSRAAPAAGPGGGTAGRPAATAGLADGGHPPGGAPPAAGRPPPPDRGPRAGRPARAARPGGGMAGHRGAGGAPGPPSTCAVDSPRSVFATVDRNDRSPVPPKVIFCSTMPSNPPRPC